MAELIRLGFTEYEARAYIGLVGLSEGTARQVHEASGVPRPRIYNIMESLERRGIVEVWQGKPRYYRAVPPDRFIRILRKDLEESIAVVYEGVRDLSLKARERTFPVWHIKGEISIQDQVRTMIHEARSELIVICTRTSLFRSLFKDLRDLSPEVSVLCMVPEDAQAFSQVLPGARIVEPKLGEDLLDETYRKLFTGQLHAVNEVYRVELVMLVDGIRSILLYNVNDERTAIVFEIPIITVLQRSAVLRLVEEAENRGGVGGSRQ